MAYWLFKSEPGTWSWEDQTKKGKEGEGWDGVRNYQANNNMKKMKIGDLGFFYHSVKEKQIVGIVRVIGEHRPDPTDKKGIFLPYEMDWRGFSPGTAVPGRTAPTDGTAKWHVLR